MGGVDLKQLRQFVAVAQSGSFLNASTMIGLAQPPLSVSIRKLEQELGVTLFDRHPRGVVLTQAGQEMLAYAQDIVTRAANLRKLMAEISSGARAPLSMGFVGSATFSLLPRLMQAFQRLHPLVEVSLSEMTTQKAIAAISDGQLDVGIVRVPLLEPAPIDILPVENDHLVLMVPPGHPLPADCVARLEDLSGEPFVMYDRSMVPNLRAVAVLACQTAGFVPDVTQEAVQVCSVMSLVESGFGLALIPHKVARRMRTRARFQEVTSGGTPIGIGLALATLADGATLATRRFRDVAMTLDEEEYEEAPTIGS